jgi:hypothetical protein
MKLLLKVIGITALVGIIGLGFWACDGAGVSTEDGTLKLSLTDAPTLADNVAGVYITVNEIQYNTSRDQTAGEDEGTWETMEEFTGPQAYNLLELTNGNSELLGELALPSGQYNQIRFMLDIPTQGGGTTPTNPGCYIEYDDGSKDSLFVPSGGNSGYKATGAFTVPTNGQVEVTADFDVRKAVVVTGNSRYILKPTIRLIVNNQAGKITGSVTGYDDGNDLVVYAYEDGTYDAATETAAPADDEDTRFPNAVTTSAVGDSNGYGLYYLAAGTYDLVVAEYDASTGDYLEAALIVEDVEVTSDSTTSQTIDASSLDADSQ